MKCLWIILFVFPLLVGQENTFLKMPDQQIVTPAEEKILFVGNRFTYYWNLPSIVESMAGGSTPKQHPETSIFTSDNKHPSAVGSYLAACVFLKLLTRESPLGFSRRFERRDEFG